MSDIVTYPLDGITYSADDAAGYFSSRTSGVFSAEEDFAVTPAGGLAVSVGAGRAWVHPSRWVGHSIIMQQATTLTLSAADSQRARIDRVVLRYDAQARQTSLLVLEGTPASGGSATPPEISRTALLYDLCLASITRPAGSTTISAANISDTRAVEDLCSVMRDGVTGIPTAQLVAQWQAAQAQQEADARAQQAELVAELRAKIAELAAEIDKLDDGSFYTKDETEDLLKDKLDVHGTAEDSVKWGGKTLSLEHDTQNTWIPVFASGTVNYVLKSEIAGLNGIQAAGGGYIRFTNGMQMCWGAVAFTVPAGRTQTVNLTFAAAFANSPVITLGIRGNATNDNYSKLVVHLVTNDGINTGFTAYGKNTSTGQMSPRVNYIAVGFWK